MLKTAASEAEAEAARREDITLQLAHSERARLEVRGFIRPLPDALRLTQHLIIKPQKITCCGSESCDGLRGDPPVMCGSAEENQRTRSA